LKAIAEYQLGSSEKFPLSLFILAQPGGDLASVCFLAGVGLAAAGLLCLLGFDVEIGRALASG